MLNESELKKLDLNLLLTFSALMQERTTTGAARRLYLGQSAISMALRRLRDTFADELFIRVGKRLEPTARAEQLYQQILPALQQIQQTVRGVSDDKIADYDFELRLGMTDDTELPLMANLFTQLKNKAPKVELSIHRAPMTDVVNMLESGKIDLSLSYYPVLPMDQS